MESFYDALAYYYDQMQSDMDCNEVASYVISLIEKHYPQRSLPRLSILDLGCGTGQVAKLIAAKGALVTGMDNSPEMLTAASGNDDGGKVIWVLQDITEFELPQKQDVFLSLTDTLDHIMDEDVLRRLFRNVKDYLNPGGLFIFDVITEHHLKDVLADNVFYEDYDDFTLLWVNSYDEKTKVNTADLTLFELADDGRYERYDGVLEEKFYPMGFFKAIAEDAGLAFKGMYGNLSQEAPKPDEERIFMVFKSEEDKDGN